MFTSKKVANLWGNKILRLRIILQGLQILELTHKEYKITIKETCKKIKMKQKVNNVQKLSKWPGRFEKEPNRTFKSENIITKVKDSMNMVNNRLDSAEERLSKLEDRSDLITQNIAERHKMMEM